MVTPMTNTTGKLQAHSSSIVVFRRISVLFVCLALIAALAGCTRDRPVPTPEPGAVEVIPASGDIEVILPSMPDTATVPLGDSAGEPQVVAVTPVPAEEGSAEGSPGEEVIEEYEVQPGDTLLSIALQFDTTTERLRELNFMTTDMIQAGQMLRVPVIPPPPTPTPSPFYHTVAAGESLSMIAGMYDVSMIELTTANRLSDPNALRAGMELLIPGYMPDAPAEESGVEGAAGAEGEGETAAPLNPDEQAVHVVQPGETLLQIANTYGVSATALAQANGLANRNQLRTGQNLLIPGVTVQQALDLRSSTHVVAAGESLSEIAQQYGVTTQQIIERNKLSNPNAIYVGQNLVIPAPQ